MSQMPPASPPPPDARQYVPPVTPGAMPAGPAFADAPGATTGLVLGICSIVFTVPVIGLILAWVGFTKSRDAKALCAYNPGMYSNHGVAQAGYVCSIIGLVLNSFSTLCGCGYFAMAILFIFGAAATGSGF